MTQNQVKEIAGRVAELAELVAEIAEGVPLPEIDLTALWLEPKCMVSINGQPFFVDQIKHESEGQPAKSLSYTITLRSCGEPREPAGGKS